MTSAQTAANEKQTQLRNAWILIVPKNGTGPPLHPQILVELARPNAPVHFSVPVGRYGGNDVRGFIMKGSDFERWAPTINTHALGAMSPQQISMFPLEGETIEAALEAIKNEVRESSPLRLAGDVK